MNTPSPLRVVLAATDLSAPSRHGAERAARLARASDATLTLLHVVSASALDALRQWLGANPATEKAVVEQSRGELHQMAQELSQRLQWPVTERLSSGTVLDDVLAAADELAADLIVVGARGTGFVRRRALGSTAERLLRRSRRPVLVVRRAAHEPYRRVLVPVDFSPWAVAAIAQARRVAPQAHLVLLHAWNVPFEEKLHFAGVDEATVEHYRRNARAEAERRLHQLALDNALAPGSWTPCLVQGEASLRIVEQEQEQDCDLIAIGKHGRHIAEELLLGSVTKHVLAETQADVLVASAVGSG
ncbi:MAG: universal stress protein [Rubrivivax sp.]|nr:universal stress protein [Rubrivivax sp.]